MRLFHFYIAAGSYSSLLAIYSIAIIVIILAILLLLWELIDIIFFAHGRYFLNWQNCIQLPLYLLAIIFAFVFQNDCGCPINWQWQIGIFVIFLAWMNLILYASSFPLIGIYVIMFKEIGWTFLKLLLFTILLVLSFAMIFFMMFYNPFAEVRMFLLTLQP